MKEITYEEYKKADEIVRRYEYQQKPKTVHVSVIYDANVFVNLTLPAEWSIEEIKKELTGGPYYALEREDADKIKYGKIAELIVNGDVIKI